MNNSFAVSTRIFHQIKVFRLTIFHIFLLISQEKKLLKSNVTEVRSASFGLMLHAQHIFAIFTNSCLPLHGAPDECYYNTLLCCEEYFLSSSVVSRASLRYACIRCSHPLGYLCAKFRFCGIHC